MHDAASARRPAPTARRLQRAALTRPPLRAVTALAVVALAATSLQPSVAVSAQSGPPDGFHAGSVDLHDPLVPGLGNGGYDVSHYGIHLHYSMATGMLVGSTTVQATLTENLSRFDLDFALPVQSVTVNGEPAAFRLVDVVRESRGVELIVRPQSGLPAGSHMTVVVSYAAKPAEVQLDGFSDWMSTATGVTVWDEPDAASEWWYPSNAYPSDKATYDVTVTAGKAYQAITNGALVSRTVHGSTATSHWRSTAPMATYLSFLNIGRYDVVRGVLRGGTPTYFAYEHTGSAYVARARHDVSRLPSILDVLQRWWGPYPFDAAGAIVPQTPYGTAFESQTRPTYTALYWRYHPHNVWAVVHEAAHQWYGDNVTMSRWRHIWLAEGFATYSEWAWSQANGNGTAQELFDSNYALYPEDDPFWSEPVVDPAYPLDSQVYERGAMTLQALRNRVGTQSFFAIMRAWTRLHRHANGASVGFELLAERISGQDLGRFFDVWLHSAHRPAPTRRNGFPAHDAALLAAGSVTTPRSFAAIARTDAALERTPLPTTVESHHLVPAARPGAVDN